MHSLVLLRIVWVVILHATNAEVECFFEGVIHLVQAREVLEMNCPVLARVCTLCLREHADFEEVVDLGCSCGVGCGLDKVLDLLLLSFRLNLFL